MSEWHVVGTHRMTRMPFDIVLKAQNDWIPPWLANDVYHAVELAHDCMRDAYNFLLLDPLYAGLTNEQRLKFKWGAYQCFRCRRPGWNTSPFTHQQHQALLANVKGTYDGLLGSHGDLILKLGFGETASQSGISAQFMKLQGMALEGFVGAHPFGRRQHAHTRPSETTVLGWKCVLGDMHLAGDFLDCCGTPDEELAIRVLIHEATHKFVGAKDVTYFGCSRLNALSTFWGAGAQATDELLNNADSITMFCLLVTGWLDGWIYNGAYSGWAHFGMTINE